MDNKNRATKDLDSAEFEKQEKGMKITKSIVGAATGIAIVAKFVTKFICKGSTKA